MELLIAVFGLLFYFCAISGDKAATKEHERSQKDRSSWYNERKDAWCGKVFDRTVVHEVREQTSTSAWVPMLVEAYLLLPSCRGMTSAEVARIIQDELLYHKKDNAEYQKCLMWALAKRGKIVSDCDDINRFVYSPASTEHEKLIWDLQYEFSMAILREIKKFAPESRMIFTTPWDLDHRVAAYDAERDLEKFRYKVGGMRWLQLTYFDSNLQLR